MSASADWTVLEIDGVMDIANKAAAITACRYVGTIDCEDAAQEAVLMLASNPDKVRAYVELEQYGFLHHWLVQRLSALVKTEAQHRANHTSFERAIEGEE